MKTKKKYSKIKNKDYYNIIFYALLITFLLIGLDLRTRDIPEEITINTVSFFYTRTKDLYYDGRYPIGDSKSLYPLTYKENYPPFLSFFTVGLYKIVEIFNVNLHYFIVIFPVLMYLFLFFFGFFMLAYLYNKITGLFFIVLLTIMPVANKLTVKGYYTEEALGVLLVLISIFFIIKCEANKKYVFLSIVALTLLALTWQVFIFILAGILILLIIKIKSKKHFIKYLSMLILPIFLAHIISIYLIGIDYSPISMFKESYLGIKEGDTVDFKIALGRGKLRPMDFDRFVEEYSYFGVIFLIFGSFICLKNIKRPKYYIVIVFTILSVIFLLKYIKFRFLALVPILIMSSIGLEGIFNRFKKYKKSFVLITIIIAIGLLIIANYDPKCEMKLFVPEEIQINETYNVTIQVKNIGRDSLCDDNLLNKGRAFSGLHIEVENAKIINKKAYSSFTSVQIIEQASINDIEWFEVKIDCLKKSAIANVTFTIKPYKSPVKINYRCWIPNKCNRKAPEDLRPEYRVSWRNEKCLHRMPTKGEFCNVKVYAGYYEKQDYYCLSEVLE